MRALMLALLFPAFASAQPVIGPEIRSAAFQSLGTGGDTPSPALGIVPTPTGFAMTWSAIAASGRSRIYFATLNAAATTTSVVEVPALNDADDAFNPALAFDGNGLLVAWAETGSANPRGVVAVAHLDATRGTNGTPQRLVDVLAAPIVSWNGVEYLVGAGTTLWTISNNGLIARSLAFTIDSMSGTAVSGHSLQPATFLPPFCRVCPPRTPAFYSVRIFRPDVCDAVWNFESTGTTWTNVAFDGRQYLVLWLDKDLGLRAFRMDASCRNVGAVDALYIDRTIDASAVASNPQAAWDGARFLIVYQSTTNEIRGAVMHDDNAETPFVITSDGRRPTVIAAGTGRFLVAYEVRSPGGTQLAGRFIDFPPPRRRVLK